MQAFQCILLMQFLVIFRVKLDIKAFYRPQSHSANCSILAYYVF